MPDVLDVTYKSATPSTRSLLSGNYKVNGNVREGGVGIFCEVLLYDAISKLLVGRTFTDAGTGAYTFTNIPKSRYFVIAFDHNKVYDPVAADSIESLPM